MERMQRFGPEFIDITWGAGGTSADLTTELVATAQSVYGLETMMHLTCTNMPVEKIDAALKVDIYIYICRHMIAYPNHCNLGCQRLWLSKHPCFAW